MKRILTIGSAVYDIFIEYEQPISKTIDHHQYLMLPEGRKIAVTAVSHYSGGGATNSAVAFKQLGFNVESFFKVGADAEGEFVLQEMRDYKVIIDHVITTEQTNTGTSYIILSPSGNHPILVDRGANLLIAQQDLPLDQIAGLDQLYVSSLSGTAADVLPIIAQTAAAQKVPLATNPGMSQLTENTHSLLVSLPLIHTLILNAHEAQYLMCAMLGTGTPYRKKTAQYNASIPELFHTWMNIEGQAYTIQDYFDALAARGVKIAVVTNGAEGVYVANGNHLIFHRAPRVTVVSSVGAGDAFASCFVGSLALGHSLENAVRRSIINSMSVLQYIGAKTGLLSSQELDQRLESFDKTLLQDYKH